MALATLRGGTVPVRMWARPEEVGSAALDQLRRIASLPWVHSHVAAMPDVHLGKGATVGSVIAMRGAVSPAAVGVDIGCGMTAVRTTLTAAELPDDLGALRSAVEAAIPVGHRGHEEASRTVERLPLWASFEHLAPAVHARLSRAQRQLGTLGGGNHFIELCLEDAGDGPSPAEGDPRVWLMLHSGSRNIGKELAEHHIGVAKSLPHNTDLPDRDLAVLLDGSEEMRSYRHDLFWAQEYARCNREAMLDLYTGVLRRLLPQVGFGTPISCHHNYVAEELVDGVPMLVTRKGAIRARAGELGIIPGSMGARSYIVRGKGNPASFCSCSHGAGRRMSRAQAKKAFSVDDLRRQTQGVECRKDAGVLDEIPGAYKDIDTVMANQGDLVEVVRTLKQLVCVKG